MATFDIPVRGLSIHEQPTQVIQTLPPAAWPEAEAAPAPRRRGFPWLRLLLLLLLALLGFLAAALLMTPARETVLVLGSDARPDELQRGEVGRTDTLLTVVADRAMPNVSLISVPRDLWVTIPGHGEERVNAAYELGGGATAKQTIANVLGIRVDRYAVIGLQGVRDIVDAIGGVDVTVDQAIYDDAYPTDDYGTKVVNIPAGRQHMDGETALEYARTRHQDSDFGRVARQQRVLVAVRNAMLNPSNWPRVPATLAAAQRSIRSDVSPFDLVAIATAFARAPGDPQRLVLDTQYVTPFTGGDGAYLLRATPGLQGAVARFLGGYSAPVAVLNGAGVAGIAQSTADRLAQQGFEIAQVGNAPRPQAQTTVVARPPARRTADAVASALGLPGGRVSESADLPAGADVQVVLGSDARR